MVTESGEVPVPRGARWAALTSVGPAQFEGRAQNTTRTVLNVSDKKSIRVDVGEVGAIGPGTTSSGGGSSEGGMVLIEWLFDADDTGSH
jgi:hypothetical protein